MIGRGHCPLDGEGEKVYNDIDRKKKGGDPVNAIISEAEYRKQIGKTAGKAYLFFGDEDYLKVHAVRLTRENLCPEPAFAVFNDVTIDAVDYTPEGLLSAISAPPMMSDGKLVLLRGMDFTAMKQAEIDGLVETLALLSEYDLTTVVIYVAAGLIDAGYLPKRPSSLFKRLAEVAVPVQFDTVSGARLVAWCAKHFAHFGVTAGPDECRALLDLAGQNMFVLASEIEKLAYFVRANGRDALTAADVRGVASPQYTVNAFALSNAVLAGNYKEALEVLSVMKFERAEPTVVLGELSRTLCDMHAVRLLLDAGRTTKEIAEILKQNEYKVGLIVRAVFRVPTARIIRAVDLCAAADLSLKRSAGDYAAIETLICSL